MKMSLLEYKRRVFNEAVMYGCLAIYESVIEANDVDDLTRPIAENAMLAAKMMYGEAMNLDESTIGQTKTLLSEAPTYIQDLLSISETIAEDKKNVAKDADVEFDKEDEIELSEEDKALLDKLFEDKNPGVQIDQIRDASVNAMMMEDRRATEIKEAISIAQAQVDAGEAPPESIQETSARINASAPNSLMFSLLNSYGTKAIESLSESGNLNPSDMAGTVRANKDIIRMQAQATYCIYESVSVLGLKGSPYTQQDIRELAQQYYHNK